MLLHVRDTLEQIMHDMFVRRMTERVHCERFTVKGRVGDLVKKHFCYIGWMSLHVSIVITKLSGLNVFILSVEGVEP